MSLLTRQTLLQPAARPRAAAQQKAEAEGRHESVAEALKEKERRLAEAKGELDKAHKEARHVDSQAGHSCLDVLCLPRVLFARHGRVCHHVCRAACHAAKPLHLRLLPLPAMQRNRLALQLEEVEGQLREARQVRFKAAASRGACPCLAVVLPAAQLVLDVCWEFWTEPFAAC